MRPGLWVVLLLPWLGTGCFLDLGSDPPPFFRFVSPRLSVPAPSQGAEFALRIPEILPRARVRVRLDGQRLDPAAQSRGPRFLRGPLDALAPGPHVLAATLRFRLLGFFPVRLRTHLPFEVVDAARYAVRESVEQLHITGAAPGTPLVLVDRRGRRVDEGVADELGSLVFRQVPPKRGYRVLGEGSPREVSGPLRVVSVEESLPEPDFYASQVLEPGFGYITTRDGTRLSVFVSLPGPPEEGPYPTLVNYSGYSPSRPAGPLSLGDGPIDLGGLCGTFPVLCDAPDHPAGLIGGILGFATVGVNMRGTGCSGGAYDFFETLQSLDGYDVIETVAAQDWVLHNQVGMAGISYPGISQLFVAATRPPSLAAITPLSVIASAARSTLAPGGIVNNGFAVEWATRVLDRADPYGQGWEQERVDEGDTVCEENQLLHGQKVDIIAKARAATFYDPEIWDPVDPATFVDRIEVPVFTAGAWQDEQTGGHFATMWDRFTGTPVFRAVAYNGAHADGYMPQILMDWKAFLDLYVTREVPNIDPLVRDLAPLIFLSQLGVPVEIPENRFEDIGSYEEARAAYESEAPVRIIYESGGNPAAAPGVPEGSFEAFFDAWPPEGLDPRRLYLHPDGTLQEWPYAGAEAASRFDHDPEKGQETFDREGPFEVPIPDHTWLPWQEGRQAVFLSPPLAEDWAMAGSASADLWIRSDAEDADLEVLLSEVRDDGQERYVQSGWLRASRRALSPESTPLRPIPSQLEEEAAPLPADAWSLVRIEIFPFAHVFRAGTRIRLAVSTPGGNRPLWKFETLEYDRPVSHRVGHASDLPSSLLLPVVPGIAAPPELPPCPSLRSQPCRGFVAHENEVE